MTSRERDVIARAGLRGAEAELVLRHELERITEGGTGMSTDEVARALSTLADIPLEEAKSLMRNKISEVLGALNEK